MSKSFRNNRYHDPEEGREYDVRDKQQRHRDERRQTKDYLKHLDVNKIRKKNEN